MFVMSSTFMCVAITCIQGCGKLEPTVRHFDLYTSLLSCSPYTLYTIQFQYTEQSLHLSENVLHDWLFSHQYLHHDNLVLFATVLII